MSYEVLRVFKGYPDNTLFVGVDLGKSEHCARAVAGSCKEGTDALYFANSRKGYESLLSMISDWKKKCGSSEIAVGIGFRGNFGIPLEHFLGKAGFDVYRIHPPTVKQVKEVWTPLTLKCNKKEALLTAKLLSKGEVLTSHLQESELDPYKFGEFFS